MPGNSRKKKDTESREVTKMISAWERIRTNQSTSLYIMLATAVVITFTFRYIPLYGIIIAFQNFKPVRGMFGAQEWIGLANFKYIFTMPEFYGALRNTLVISGEKLFLGILVPVTAAILLNEIRISAYKRTVQTIVYFPYFISWIILGGILIDALSPSTGIVNNFLGLFGVEPIYFLADKRAFPWVLIISEVWKNYGFSMILYLAAISNIDPGLYESAIVDGAGIFKRMLNVTLPGLIPMISLSAVLSIGQLLNAGFEQVFTLLNDSVVETGEIIDTLVYKMGIGSSMYSMSTSVGLFKSLVSMALLSFGYYIAYKKADYKVF